MSFDLQRLARLWNDPPSDDDAAARLAFGEVYADPVVINDESISLPDLVALARRTHAMYQEQERTVLEVVETGDKVAFAFVLRARQDGRPVAIQIIDILTLRSDGLVATVRAVQQALPAEDAGDG